ncbi:MAG: hypothetical protein WBA89_04230 [Microcoleus sp.]
MFFNLEGKSHDAEVFFGNFLVMLLTENTVVNHILPCYISPKNT